MRITVDTNILIYAADQQTYYKHEIALDIMDRGRHVGMILEAQVLGEFLNAVRRKNLISMDEALKLVDLWTTIFPVVQTGARHIAAGGRLALRHRLQFWDSVILEIARVEGIGVLLTEDMQDGATIGGVTLLNPFHPANMIHVDTLLAT